MKSLLIDTNIVYFCTNLNEMKRLVFFTALLLLCNAAQSANNFGAKLTDKTLRLDYIFSGTDKTAEIALDALYVSEGWAGRRVNMDKVPVRGNGQLKMVDSANGEVLYMMSFGTLFQEWQTTEEATLVRKSFENVFLAPMPTVPVSVTLTLYDVNNRVEAEMTHPVNPSDILIRPVGKNPVECRYVHKSGPVEKCIDVAIVAEGYTADEMELFYEDAREAFESIMNHEPFGTLRDKFNFIAVPLVSQDSGVSIPKQGIWKNTAVSSNYDTFYSDRYLTTLRVKRLHDALDGIPYEHIIILANTDNYGGGGIYNSYTLTTAHHPAFKPVVVHEFGHSFAGLADEYYYDDMYVQYYYPGVEPWEQNITTMTDFGSKWEDMMGKDGVGLKEGGGYRSKGVWRAMEDCRMKTNSAPVFCPVCRRAIRKMIEFYAEE